MESSKDAEHREHADRDRSDPTLSVNTHDEPHNQPTTNELDKPNHLPEPSSSFAVRLWRRFLVWKRNPHRPKAHLAEWATVLLTGVIAAIGALQYSVYRQQKAIMESSGHQTDQLITAAKIQAGAATKNADSAESMATSAQQQVIAAKIQAFAARSEVAPLMQLDEWMGSYHLEGSNRIVAVAAIKNIGKTPAEHVSIALRIGLQNSPPIQSQYRFKDAEFQGDRQLLPFTSSQVRTTVVARAKKILDRSISPAQYPTFLQKKAVLYIWGEVKFADHVEQPMPPFNFCKYVPLQSVLRSSPSPPSLDHGGINTGFSECEQITADSYP